MTPTQLRKLLDKAQISQIEAARQLGIDARTMRRYVAEGAVIPRVVELAIETVIRNWKPQR